MITPYAPPPGSIPTEQEERIHRLRFDIQHYTRRREHWLRSEAHWRRQGNAAHAAQCAHTARVCGRTVELLTEELQQLEGN